jgi:hypothetical protein
MCSGLEVRQIIAWRMVVIKKKMKIWGRGELALKINGGERKKNER